MMSAETWRKRCGCSWATVSGPRVVLGKPERTPQGVNIPVRWVMMVCDQCNTPWERVDPPAPFVGWETG